MPKNKPWEIIPKSLTRLTRMSENMRLFQGNNLNGIIPILEQQQRLAYIFNPSPMTAFKALGGFHTTWTSLIRGSFLSITEPFARMQAIETSLQHTFEVLDEKTKKMVEACIKEGWYPIPGLAIGFCPKTENFEAEMAAAIEEDMPNIEKILCEHHPTRKASILSGFKAHRRGEFELSIPCLFPQANGICKDIIGINPFENKAGERLKGKRSDGTTYSKLYFKPLFEAPDIRGNTEIVPPDKLNRHAVMHGTSTACFTKINSLKLISFIGNLDWFLDNFREAGGVSAQE